MPLLPTASGKTIEPGAWGTELRTALES